MKLQMLTRQTQSSHWYLHDAAANLFSTAYEIPSLTEARKLNAYTSPTTVIKIKNKDNLTDWRLNELAKAFVANPKLATESLENWVARVQLASDDSRNEAASFGTKLHDCLEKYPERTENYESFKPWIDKFSAWFDTNIASITHREICVGHTGIGVCGRVDFIGVDKQYGPIIIDYKTQDFKGGKPKFYPEWRQQLAFYQKSYQRMYGITPVCASLAIDKATPSAPIYKVYAQEQIDEAWKTFLVLTYLWCAEKGHGGYWPCGKWELHSQWL